uniref:Reverse transcriptase n=1 Tax=Tanacetum cinerariifolium TaxID=118510 RepID=A0A6L2N4D0_TANCI|nr:reverse transcriptase [Tanacetum cinerariifolium]
MVVNSVGIMFFLLQPTMMATRSTDNGVNNQGGLLTGSYTIENQLASMINLINHFTDTVTTLEGRINVGKGTSQRREVLVNGGTHVKKRFESVFEDPVVELKNLKQTTSVQVYQDSFEELLNKVELNEPYAISLFIGGLKEDIAYVVRWFKPTSLVVFCLSKLQEANNSVSKIRHTPVLTTPKSSSNVNKGGGIVPRIVNNAIPNRPFKKLTRQELEEKRAKHLYFFCD